MSWMTTRGRSANTPCSPAHPPHSTQPSPCAKRSGEKPTPHGRCAASLTSCTSTMDPTSPATTLCAQLSSCGSASSTQQSGAPRAEAKSSASSERSTPNSSPPSQDTSAQAVENLSLAWTSRTRPGRRCFHLDVQRTHPPRAWPLTSRRLGRRRLAPSNA